MYKGHKRLVTRIKNKLIKQGKPSRHPFTNSCLYTMKNDKGEKLHCGIGFEIPKQFYKEEYEGMGAVNVKQAINNKIKNRKYKPAIVKANNHLLAKIQGVHDKWLSNEEGETFEAYVERQLGKKSSIYKEATKLDKGEEL